jgi:DNA-binding transcriptional ArsR family regulator
MFLLRVKEMAVAQIAEELDVTPQAVYHHVRKLLAGGIVEVVREERLGHLIESYYRTTAESFNFTMGKTSTQTAHSRKVMKEQEIATLNALKKLGFEIEFDEKQVDELIDVGVEMDKCCTSPKLEDRIATLNLDFPTQVVVTEYAGILSMSNAEFEQTQGLRAKLRDSLRSLLKKKK